MTLNKINLLLLGMFVSSLGHANIVNLNNRDCKKDILVLQKSSFLENVLKGYVRSVSENFEKASYFQKHILRVKSKKETLENERVNKINAYFKKFETLESLQSEASALVRSDRERLSSLQQEILWARSNLLSLQKSIRDLNTYLDINDPCFGVLDPSSKINQLKSLDERITDLTARQVLMKDELLAIIKGDNENNKSHQGLTTADRYHISYLQSEIQRIERVKKSLIKRLKRLSHDLEMFDDNRYSIEFFHKIDLEND